MDLGHTTFIIQKTLTKREDFTLLNERGLKI